MTCVKNEVLILGTASPRRIALLSQFTLKFKAIASDFDEDSIPFHLPPRQYVQKIAEGKAEALNIRFPNAPILTADTSVYFENCHFGKPKDQDHAFEMLKKLRGKEHEVWTGLCLAYKGELHSLQDVTTVRFNDVSDENLQQYIKIFNPIDKAGSYAIQDAAGLLVNQISGNYQNVIGFPLTKVAELLNIAGLNLWDYLKHRSLD